MLYIVNFTTGTTTREERGSLIIYESIDSDGQKQDRRQQDRRQPVHDTQINILVYYNIHIRRNRSGKFPDLAGTHLHFVDCESLNRNPRQDETGFNLRRNSIEIFGNDANKIQNLTKLNILQIDSIWKILTEMRKNLSDPTTFFLVNRDGQNRRTAYILNAIGALNNNVYIEDIN